MNGTGQRPASRTGIRPSAGSASAAGGVCHSPASRPSDRKPPEATPAAGLHVRNLGRGRITFTILAL